MILYSYIYDRSNNKITVRAVEVIETKKSFKTVSGRGEFRYCMPQIHIDKLDSIECRYNMYLVSKELNIDMFKQKVTDKLNEEYQADLNRANKILKCIDNLSECECCIKK